MRRSPEALFSAVIGAGPGTPGSPPGSTGRQVIFGLALLFLVLLSLQWIRALGKMNDFDVYYLAARSALDGTSLFAPRFPPSRLAYVYPPMLAALLAPVALLPRIPAGAVWSIVNIILLIASLRVLARALPVPDRAFHVALSLIFVSPFLVNTAQQAQVGNLLLYLMLLGLVWGDGGRLAAAVPLAAAIAIKLYPMVATLGWIVARRWKLLFTTALATILLSAMIPAIVMGPRDAAAATAEYWTAILTRNLNEDPQESWYGYKSNYSQSILSAVYRVTTDPDDQQLFYDIPPAHLATLSTGARMAVSAGIYLIVLVAAALALWRVSRMDGPMRIVLTIGIVISLSPMLSPVSLKSTFALLLPTHAAWFVARRSCRTAFGLPELLYALGVWLHLFPFRVFTRDLDYAMNADSSVLVGTVLIFASLLLLVRSVRTGAPPAAGLASSAP